GSGRDAAAGGTHQPARGGPDNAPFIAAPGPPQHLPTEQAPRAAATDLRNRGRRGRGEERTTPRGRGDALQGRVHGGEIARPQPPPGRWPRRGRGRGGGWKLHPWPGRIRARRGPRGRSVRRDPSPDPRGLLARPAGDRLRAGRGASSTLRRLSGTRYFRIRTMAKPLR